MAMRILIGLMSVSSVCGAGMTTHTMAGYRAINYFGKIMHSPNASLYNDALDSNVEAVLAGSDFPDFLYACGKYQVTSRPLVCASTQPLLCIVRQSCI